MLLDAGCVVDVIVYVDDVELGFRDLVRGDVKHGDRMKIPQQERFLLLRVRRRLVADLVRGGLPRGWVLSLCLDTRNAKKKKKGQRPRCLRCHVNLLSSSFPQGREERK